MLLFQPSFFLLQRIPSHVSVVREKHFGDLQARLDIFVLEEVEAVGILQLFLHVFDELPLLLLCEGLEGMVS